MITYRQPFAGEYPITQRYGEVVEGVTYKGQPHTGIDYGCPFMTEILASAEGTVMFAGLDNTGYGNVIMIQHPDRKATVYAHLENILVKTGQSVRQGAVIGESGYTGNVYPKGVTGTHLHFEARSVWWDPKSHQDPVTFLPLRSVDDSIRPEPAAEPEKPEPKKLNGICRVVCDAAFKRYWDTLSRDPKLVYKGELVYVFGDRVKYQDGLPFYYIGAGLAMAAYDNYGTVILEEIKDGNKEEGS